jgi:Ca2+-binding EF-hand superfamily protein
MALKNMRQIWRQYDADLSGNLDHKETFNFMKHMFNEYPSLGFFYKEKFHKYFKHIDCDKDNKISQLELLNFLIRLKP